MRFAKYQRLATNKCFTTIKSLFSQASNSQHVLTTGLRNIGQRTMMLGSVAVFLCAPLAAMSNDENRAYYGVGLGSTSGSGLRMNAYDFHAGYEFRPWMTFEGHLGSTSSDKGVVNGVTFEEKLDYYNSIRVRFNMVARDYRAYTYFGFTTTSINVSGSDNIKRAGYAYGVGIDLFGNESTALYASVGRLLDHDIDDTKTKFSQFLVGFRYYLKDNYARSRLPDRMQF